MQRTLTRNLIIAVAIGATFLSLAAAPAPASTRCSGAFQGNVRSGPDADLSLIGRLTFDVNGSGKITGRLVQREGSRRVRVARVRGQVHGRRLELRFRTRSGKRIVGVGEAKREISGCADLPGTGSLTGPRRGDRGDWGYALGG